MRRGSVDVVSRDWNIFCAYPVWCWHPLTGEGLDIFDCMMGSVDEELADEVETDVVGDVGGGLLMEGFAVEVLQSPRQQLSSYSGHRIHTCDIQVSTTVGVTAAPTDKVLKGMSAFVLVRS